MAPQRGQTRTSLAFIHIIATTPGRAKKKPCLPVIKATKIRKMTPAATAPGVRHFFLAAGLAVRQKISDPNINKSQTARKTGCTALESGGQDIAIPLCRGDALAVR